VNLKGIKNWIIVFILGTTANMMFPYCSYAANFTKDKKKLNDTTIIRIDSLVNDTILRDSLLSDSLQEDSDYYEPFLNEPVFGTNKDSLIYNLETKEVFAWRSAEIKYEDMQLGADHIAINTETKNVRAEGLYPADTTNMPDSLKVLSRPVFKQGSDTYEVDSMIYNMESGKALIKGVNTKQGESIIWGGTVKKMPDNVINMHKGRYTVCDHEHPHFYLQMTKGTVIPDKNTVFGPSYLVMEDVPVYFLGVPFGFFPQTKERNSGIIIPEFGEETVKGFFIRNGGYYFALGDHFDLKLLGGIYTLGSWQVGAASSYNKRYKYRGNFSFEYAANKIGEKSSADYVDTRNIAVRWTHAMDSKATNGLNFSASVNFTSSSYNKYQAQNINDYLSSQTSSSISLSKSWTGTPFSLSATASLSQNTRDSTITMNFPTLTFNVSRIAPFKRKYAVGKEKWYEKISFTYGMNFKNDLSNIKEDQLFSGNITDKAKFGFNHNIPVSASFNVKGWLNITPSLQYQERWYFRSIEQNWDENLNAVVKDTTSGFYRLSNYSFSLGSNTKLYGMYIVGKKKPVFFRHLFTPSLSASFTPDCGSRYYNTIQKDSLGNTMEYSPWSQELYGVPSKGSAAAMNINFGNTLEAKVHSDLDSTGYKKIKIIEKLDLSTSYNFLADSLNLSPIAMNMQTNIANKFPISFTATFDPYALDENGKKYNKYLVEEGGFLRMTALSFSLGYGFQGGKKQGGGQTAANNIYNTQNTAMQTAMNNQDTFFRNKEEKGEDVNKEMTSRDIALMAASQYYDFSIPWSFSFSYSFSYSKPGRDANISQTMNFNANINLTSKWAISGSAGYDFSQGKFTPGTIRVTRDLHCWQMNFQWVPIGFRQSWTFCLNVKSSMLADLLKAEKRNSFYDNIYGW